MVLDYPVSLRQGPRQDTNFVCFLQGFPHEADTSFGTADGAHRRLYDRD
jgi:hypothetical protein